MKTRIKELICTYEAMAKKMRQGAPRALLENVIEDLKQALMDAQ